MSGAGTNDTTNDTTKGGAGFMQRWWRLSLAVEWGLLSREGRRRLVHAAAVGWRLRSSGTT